MKRFKVPDTGRNSIGDCSVRRVLLPLAVVAAPFVYGLA
jgi:hypothetical protein